MKKNNSTIFESWFKNNPDVVFMMDFQGMFIETNDQAIRQFGYSQKQLHQMSFFDLFIWPEMKEGIQKASNEKQFSLEGIHEIRKKDNKSVEINISSVKYEGRHVLLCLSREITVQKGDYYGKVNTSVDISERKLAQKAQREQVSIMRSILNSTDALIFSVDWHYKYTSFNERHASVMQQIYGKEPKIGVSLLEFMSVKVDREIAKGNIDRALSGEQLVQESYSGEEFLSRRYFRVSHSPIRIETGEVVGVVVLAQDLTEHKRAEEYLSKEAVRGNLLLELYEKAPQLSEKQLYDYTLEHAVRLTDSTIGFLHIVSDDQKSIILTTWNSEALKNCTALHNTHYPIDEAGNWVDCIRLRQPLIYNDYTTSPNQKGLPEGHSPLHRFMSIPVMDGEKARIIFGVGNKIEEYDNHDVVHIQLVANELQKIIKQRHAEEALRESQERYRLIAENTADTITVLNLDLNLTYVSPSVQKLRGYSAEETISQSLEQIFTPASVQKINKIFADQMSLEASGKADLFRTESLELEEYCKDGSTIWVEIAVSLIRDIAFRPTSILTVTRDVTKRKHAELRLIDSEQKYRSLAESSPDNIIRYDSESNLVYANRNVDLTLGFDLGSRIGKPPLKNTRFPAQDNYLKKLRQVIHTGQPDELEVVFPNCTGELRAHHIRFVAERNNEGKIIGALSIGRDITERVRAEEALHRAHDEMELNIEQRTAELKKANEQLAALYKVGQVITAPLHLKKVLDVIALNTAKLLGSDTGVILLVDEGGETLTIKGAFGLKKDVVDGTRDRVGESIAGRVVQTGKPIVANDLPNDPRFYNPSAASEGLLACASVPLVAGGKIIGTLDIHSKTNRHAFNEEHIHVLNMLASQAAIAIENAQLYEQIQFARDELEIRVQQRTSELVTNNEQLQQGIAERKRAEVALWESSQMLKLVLNNMPAFVFWKDRNSVYLGCNSLFAANAGLFSPEEIIGKTDLDLPWKFDEAESYRNDDLSVMETEIPKLNYEETQHTADGRITWVRTSKVPLRNVEGDIIGLLGTFEDITERKRADQEIAHMNRSLRMLSNSNQVLIHTADEAGLYNEICRNIVEVGGYLMAWVGLIEHDEQKTIRRVAQMGHDSGYIKSADVSWADNEYGQSPCGISIRTGQPCIVHNVQSDLVFAPWREAAIERGYMSIIALPLINEGLSIGALGIYSGEKDAFNDKEVEILTELADDLAFGISTLRSRDIKKQAEDALRDSEERFSAVFHFSPFAIAIFRADDSCIIDVNDVFINSSGYSREEIIGHTTAELGLYINLSDHDIAMQKLQEKGMVESFEFDTRNKAGEIRTVISALTYIDIKGVKHYLALILDITERKKSEERLRLLSSALEAAANSIVITDHEAKIIWANDAFSKLAGYTLDETIGKKPRDLVYSGIHSHEFYQHMWKTILNGNEWHGEIINKRKDGTIFNEFLTITPVRDENYAIRHFIAVKQDITKQKKAEEELQKAKEKAEESNSLKSAFLATMNHELRTPLNHILGFSDLMRSGSILENITDYADIIHKSSQNLLEIIEDIFELALAEQSEIKLRLQTFKCLDLFLGNKAVLTEILEISGKKDQIELVFNADKELLLQNITSDKNKINQVLINLFKNAVKFTKSGKIEFGLKADEPGWLAFYVEDTGIGIPENKHEIIFEFFRQADDSHTREYGGVGIGLAISQKIAEVMKGTLSLESMPDKGSKFFFRIPVSISNLIISPIHNGNNKISIPDLLGKTILIAEDDPVSIDLIKKFLSSTGVKLIEAANGKEVIEKLNFNPDAILMDLNMPIMDGYTATRMVKSRRPDIPVIAITAYALSADKSKAAKAGCDGIISKPVEQRILFGELKKLLLPD
jgi:PAS domain S-box-containing protein